MIYIVLIIIFGVVVLYTTGLGLTYFLLVNNLMLWKRGKSRFDFAVERKELGNPKRIYYLSHCKNSKGWVLLFHQYGGKAEDMGKRARTYLSLDYSVVMVDARGHGQSGWTRTTDALLFAQDMFEVVKAERLKNPFLLHGVSLGGFAAVFLAMWVDVKAIVVESIGSDLRTIYENMLRYSPFPYRFYWWLPTFLKWKRRHFDWVSHNPPYVLYRIKAPTLVVHSQDDNLYKPEEHLGLFYGALYDNVMARVWLVPGVGHAHLESYTLWEEGLVKFLTALGVGRSLNLTDEY